MDLMARVHIFADELEIDRSKINWSGSHGVSYRANYTNLSGDDNLDVVACVLKADKDKPTKTQLLQHIHGMHQV